MRSLHALRLVEMTEGDGRDDINALGYLRKSVIKKYDLLDFSW